MSKNNVIRSFYILLHLRFLEKSAVLDSVVLFSVVSDISSRETITWDVFSKDGSVFWSTFVNELEPGIFEM